MLPWSCNSIPTGFRSPRYRLLRPLTRIFFAQDGNTKTSSSALRTYLHSLGPKPTAPRNPPESTRIKLPRTSESRQIIEEVRSLWLKQWTTADNSRHAKKYHAILSRKSPLLMRVGNSISNQKGYMVHADGIVFNPKHPLGLKLLELISSNGTKPTFELPTNNFTRNAILLSVVIVIVLWNTSGEEVPFSGRRRFRYRLDTRMLRPVLEEKATLEESFKDAILTSTHPDSVNVKSVLDKILEASGLKPLDMELILVNDPSTINASVMYCSDDKYLFVVYTAMLTVCENKDGVATMFSHEVGHILAKHGAESVGKARMCELALRPAMILLANTRPGDLNLLEQLAAIYAVLIGVVSRSYSRQREYEADHIGVIIMHKARYDIKECARYYERMHKATEDQAGEQFKKMTEEAGEGQRVVRTPWFLLTHPIGTKRTDPIKKLTAEILEEKCKL